MNDLRKTLVEHPTKEKEGFEVTNMSLLNLQVCSRLSPDDVEMNVRRHFPAGTENNWTLEREGKLAPVPCASDPLSKHYIFSC